jgi:hypothetical protein
MFVSPAEGGYAQETPYVPDEWISQYESVMNGVAASWANNDFAKALDGLSSARTVLSFNMPLPTEIFVWRMYRTLKTYTIVLTRLVELEVAIQSKDLPKVKRLILQVEDWAEVLEDQARDWRRIEIQNRGMIAFRERWLVRFKEALDRVRHITQRVKQEG